jgi:CRISP-associated protein Cas1
MPNLLIIQSYGSKLAVRDGLFELTLIENNAFRKAEYPAHEVGAIWLHQGTSITTAAIALATEHKIDLVLLNGFGVPIGRWQPTRPTTIVTLQRAQLAAYQDEKGFHFIKTWIAEKLQNQIDFLQQRLSHHRRSETAKVQKHIATIENCRQKILDLNATHLSAVADSIRGLEGAAGRAYFQSIAALLPERYHFEQRNRFPATDAFNSALNYAYAVLYTKVEGALLKVGLNPYAGFLHADGYQQLSMVYDFVEPLRIMVEDPIFSLFSTKKISREHFEDSEEKIWLSPKGKKLIISHLQALFLEKNMILNGKKRNGEKYILSKAQIFATALLSAYLAEAKIINFTGELLAIAA